MNESFGPVTSRSYPTDPKPAHQKRRIEPKRESFRRINQASIGSTRASSDKEGICSDIGLCGPYRKQTLKGSEFQSEEENLESRVMARLKESSGERSFGHVQDEFFHENQVR